MGDTDDIVNILFTPRALQQFPCRDTRPISNAWVWPAALISNPCVGTAALGPGSPARPFLACWGGRLSGRA